MIKTRYKVGDRVRFLNETGGGVITRIDEKGFVYVEAEDGFEIPAKSSDIIPAGGFDTTHLDHDAMPEASGPDTKPPISDTKPSVPHTKVEISDLDPLPPTSPAGSLPFNVNDSEAFNIILGFTPEHPGPVFSSQIDCFLINDSEYYIYYRLGTVIQGNLYHLSSGMIEANTKYQIHTYTHTDLSKISAMHLQVLWLSDGRYTRKPVVDQFIELGSINFGKDSYYIDNEYFNDKAILFPVIGNNKLGSKPGMPAREGLSNLKMEMTREDQVVRSVKRPVNDTMEIDLHIEEIVDDPLKYTAGEILKLQLKRLDESLEEAISKKMRRLVIIHGVGQGTLKMQIRKELQEKYPEYQFQDASFREYGFGATLVHLHTIRKQ